MSAERALFEQLLPAGKSVFHFMLDQETLPATTVALETP